MLLALPKRVLCPGAIDRRGEDVSSSLEAVSVVDGELPPPRGVRPHDAEGTLLALNDNGHATHHIVIGKELHRGKPLLGGEVFHHHRRG